MAKLTSAQKASIDKRIAALKAKHKAELKSALAKRDILWRTRIAKSKRTAAKKRELAAETRRGRKIYREDAKRHNEYMSRFDRHPGW